MLDLDSLRNKGQTRIHMKINGKHSTKSCRIGLLYFALCMYLWLWLRCVCVFLSAMYTLILRVPWKVLICFVYVCVYVSLLHMIIKYTVGPRIKPTRQAQKIISFIMSTVLFVIASMCPHTYPLHTTPTCLQPTPTPHFMNVVQFILCICRTSRCKQKCKNKNKKQKTQRQWICTVIWYILFFIVLPIGIFHTLTVFTYACTYAVYLFLASDTS